MDKTETHSRALAYTRIFLGIVGPPISTANKWGTLRWHSLLTKVDTLGTLHWRSLLTKVDTWGTLRWHSLLTKVDTGSLLTTRVSPAQKLNTIIVTITLCLKRALQLYGRVLYPRNTKQVYVNTGPWLSFSSCGPLDRRGAERVQRPYRHWKVPSTGPPPHSLNISLNDKYPKQWPSRRKITLHKFVVLKYRHASLTDGKTFWEMRL
jgi:hypothetical protein